MRVSPLGELDDNDNDNMFYFLLIPYKPGLARTNSMSLSISLFESFLSVIANVNKNARRS